MGGWGDRRSLPYLSRHSRSRLYQGTQHTLSEGRKEQSTQLGSGGLVARGGWVGGRFLPPSKWDRMRVSLSVDNRQEIRASVCRRNPFKSPHLRQLLNTDLSEPLTKERKRKAARHGGGWCFTVWGAVNQPTNQLTNQPTDHYKGILALQSTYLVEEVEPLAEREKKPKPVI